MMTQISQTAWSPCLFKATTDVRMIKGNTGTKNILSYEIAVLRHSQRNTVSQATTLGFKV